MSDTNTLLPQQGSFEPGVVSEPQNPPVPQEIPPQSEPQGSFVIAENTVFPQTEQTEQTAVSSGTVPQMMVETVPEEPQPEAPVNSDMPVYSPQETVVVPPTVQDQSFVPQGLSSDQPLYQTPTVPPPPKSNNIFKTIGILFVLLLLGAGAFFALQFGSKMVNNSKEVTLTYWGLWETEAIMRPVIAAFEAENPKIKINYKKENYREYRQRLESAIDRGDGPDIFRFHATWIPMLRNHIEPVPETVLTPEEFKASFYDVAANDLLAGTTLWGIPFMIDGLGLYINEDLFSTAGATVPRTYEDLIAAVPRLTVKNGNEIVTSAIALGTTNNVDHFSDILGLMMLQNGANLVQPTGEAAQEALEFYRKFATVSDPLYTWNELQDNSIQAFANGRVAMIIAPSWRVFDIQNLNPNLRFRVEPVPQLPGNTNTDSVTWATYWVEGVSSKTPHKEQAFAFLKYITSKEAVNRLYAEAARARLFGPPYALKELGPSLLTDQFAGAYIKQAGTARSFPLASKTHDNGLNDQMIKYMENAINQYAEGVSPTQALETMSNGFNQVLSRYGLVSSR